MFISLHADFRNPPPADILIEHAPAALANLDGTRGRSRTQALPRVRQRLHPEEAPAPALNGNYHLLVPPLSPIIFSYSCSLSLSLCIPLSINRSLNQSLSNSLIRYQHTHTRIQSFLRACSMKTLLVAVPAPAVDHPHPHSTVDNHLLFPPLSPITFSFSCSICLSVFLSNSINHSLNHSLSNSLIRYQHTHTHPHTPLLSFSLPPNLRRYSRSCGHAQ